jgi:hypothetical protein
MVKIIGYIDDDGTFHEEERTTPVTTNSSNSIPRTNNIVKPTQTVTSKNNIFSKEYMDAVKKFNETLKNSNVKNKGFSLSNAITDLANIYDTGVNMAENTPYIGGYFKASDKARKTASNIATNMGEGAIKATEGIADTLSDVYFNPRERMVNYIQDYIRGGKKLADENLKDLKQQQQEDIKKNITKDFLKKIGYEDYVDEFEKDSLVKRENLGGQVAQGIGGMVPSLVLGQAYGETPNLTDLKGLTGKEKALAALGNVGRTYAAQMPANLALGAQSYGGGMEEALNEGATMNQARKFGLANAAIEQGTEMLTGGVPGLEGRGGIDQFVDPLIGKVPNNYLQALLKAGYGAFGEGLEEYASEMLNPLARKIYSDEKIDWDETRKKARQAGLVGGITGAFLNSPNTVSDFNEARTESRANKQNANNNIQKTQNIETKSNQQQEEIAPITEKNVEEINNLTEQEKNNTPETIKDNTITLNEIGQMGQDYFDNLDNKTKQDGTSDSSFLNEQTSNTKLENRVSGDKLLDAQDLINEIKDVGADIDDNGYVTVYHQTTPENAQKILDTGKMTSKEQAVFFSTSKDATQSEGRGTTKLEFKIPAEDLELDDIFSDNADVKINLNGKKDIDVSNYLSNNNKAETIQEPVIQAEPEPNFEDINNKTKGDKEVKVLESVPKEQKKPLKERLRETRKKLTRDFISKGESVENLARKRKNPALNHQYDRLGIVRGEAQEHIGTMQRDLDLKPRKNFTDANGKKSTMSLNGIREDAKTHNIPETTLNQYLAEYRNVDTAKQGKPILNKSAEASLEAIQRIESEHPEIKRIAGNVWTFEKNQLQDRVQSGLISEQFAKELLENNPHYVRVQRDVKGKRTTNTLNGTKRGVEVNRQIDTLKGSDADILPIMESIAKYTEQVQQSMRMNQFGQELLKTTGVGTQDNSISSFTDEESFGVNPNLLQDDGNGNYTLTVFNNGVATVVPIDQGLYESLTPNKTVQTLENDETFKKITYAPKKVSEMFRAVTTNQNPIFMFTNAFKDIGDAPFNSKYTGEFLKAYGSTEALREVAGNGVYNQLYEAAGGKQNSYFNNGEFVDKTQTKASKIKDKLLMPIEKGNDIVESVPRMAEFIATIKANGYEVNADGELVVKNKNKVTKSANDVLNEALYNAAEVTTNFKRGGDVAKMLNRNGATFLNASIQGFDKQVRNFTQVQTPKEAVMLLTKALIFGIAPTMLNDAMWDDDDEYEELQDYLKDNYYLFKGKDGQWIRIPKGRAMSVIGSAFRRTKNYAKGDKDAFKGFGEFAANQVAPNSVINNNIFAPLSQVKNNKSWSGNKIISDSLSKRPTEQQYNEKTDKISIALGKAIKDLPLPEEYRNFKSPLAIHYLLDQYTGVFGDTILPMFTEKSSSKYNPLIAPFIDKFTADSVYSSKSVSEYYDMKNEIETQKNSTDATPLDVAKNSYMTSRNYALSDLYKEQKQIQSDSSLSKSEKYDKAREKQKEINKTAKQIVKDVENAEEHEYYVKIGDYYYKKVIEDGEVKYKRDTSKKIPTEKYALYDYYKEKYEKSKEGK